MRVYHRIHPTFFYLLFLITAHKRKQILAEKIILFFGIIQRLFVVKIVVRIHRLIDDAIHFNRPVFRTFIGMIQPDALSTVTQILFGSRSHMLHSPHSMQSRSYKTQRFFSILLSPCVLVCSLYHRFKFRSSVIFSKNANIRLTVLAFTESNVV